jgi:predicted dehydrogenase
MNAALRVGIVGYGYWGPNLARNVDACESTELAGVCDSSEVARERAAASHPAARITSDFAELLEGQIDAIVVALPIPMHHPYALQALEAGKHVLVEKPLAMSVQQCDELIAVAGARDLTLTVGHTFLFNDAVRCAKQYLDAGDLGDPYYVSMRRTNLGIVRTDSNVMWSLAPHDISILHYWLGCEALEVSATGTAHLQEGIEDAVFLSVRFANGVVGHIHCSWLEPHKVRDATIVGSQKMLVFDDTAPESKVWLYDKGIEKRTFRRSDEEQSLGRYETFAGFQMIARAGDVLLPKIELREPLVQQIEHFVGAIASGKEPLVSGVEGRSVVAVLEAAQRSLERGGEPQPVEVRSVATPSGRQTPRLAAAASGSGA